jgi:hypothetical protein
LEIKDLNGQMQEITEVIHQGEFIDYRWKDSKYKEFTIKYIKSCSKNEKSHQKNKRVESKSQLKLLKNEKTAHF